MYKNIGINLVSLTMFCYSATIGRNFSHIGIFVRCENREMAATICRDVLKSKENEQIFIFRISAITAKLLYFKPRGYVDTSSIGFGKMRSFSTIETYPYQPWLTRQEKIEKITNEKLSKHH